jgi:serine/threonine protein kinase
VEIEKDELGNTILNGEYLISTTIEQGSYGKIKLARHITTGELYVSQFRSKKSIKYFK